MSTARLAEVVIKSADLDHDIGVFTAVTGTSPTWSADDELETGPGAGPFCLIKVSS